MPILAILGPTASGKSELALILAEKLNGEIISCDSMQVYRGMDIGTAKPSKSELVQIPHHLINCFDLNVRYNASLFCDLATKLIADIEHRGKVPILSGGTGMYSRLLLYGHDMPVTDRSLHEELKERLKSQGREHLISELMKLDPSAVEKVKDNDRRLIRALEIVMLTKKPLQQKMTWGDEILYPGLQVINLCSAELNRQRIILRTKKMLEMGWIEETENLLKNGLLDSPTACQSLGYKQIADYLNGAYPSISALEEKLVTLTCQYAKKQRTWFRNQHPGATILNRQEHDNSFEIANQIANIFKH